MKGLQQKDTIHISEPGSPKATIIRHGTIIRLLLVPASACCVRLEAYKNHNEVGGGAKSTKS